VSEEATWEDLVDTATVGLSRRPLRATGLAGPAGAYGTVLDEADPAEAVLDAAALVSAARRAGVPAAAGVRGPVGAEPDLAPELPPRAADVVRRAMAAGPGILTDLLDEAARRGYRAPAPMLPGLLDLAVRDTGLRPAVASVLGQRGRWLARYRPDWRQVAEAGIPVVPDDPAVWATGRRDERLGYLAQLRARDPAAARELLAAGWDRETGDDRALLLGVLADGLSGADEHFLEAALEDRKGSVREGATRLLARLPGSAFNRRAAERAAGLLRVERHALRRRLVVQPPEEGTLAGAVAAAPLGLWEELFGLGAGQIVALPVMGGRAAEVHAGWRAAAIREASSEWAEALLAAGPQVLRTGGADEADVAVVVDGASGASGASGAGGVGVVSGSFGGQGRPSGARGAGWREPGAWRRPAGWPEDVELAAVLTPEGRAARGAALLGGTAPGSAAGNAAAAEVAAYPGPWPDLLARAVIDVLRRGAAAGPGRAAGTLLAAAARKLPVRGGPDGPAGGSHAGPVSGGPDRAAGGDLDGLAGRAGDYAAALMELAENGTPGWAPLLRRAAGAVAARRTFMEEIR
jgi:uncharacterized protein DUF5691